MSIINRCSMLRARRLEMPHAKILMLSLSKGRIYRFNALNRKIQSPFLSLSNSQLYAPKNIRSEKTLSDQKKNESAVKRPTLEHTTELPNQSCGKGPDYNDLRAGMMVQHTCRSHYCAKFAGLLRAPPGQGYTIKSHLYSFHKTYR